MVWNVAGMVAGGAIRTAIDSSKMKRLAKEALSPAGAAVLQPVLDIERIVSDGYYFQFGVPWGWDDFTPDQVQILTGALGQTPVAGVVAARQDANSARLCVLPMVIDDAEWVDLFMDPYAVQKALMSRIPNARTLGEPVKIKVDGELALLIRIVGDHPGEQRGHPESNTVPVGTTILFVRRNGQGFRIWCDAAYEHYDRYKPCIWTMLGSWRWLR